jgi:predicted Zn-dependent protease
MRRFTIALKFAFVVIVCAWTLAPSAFSGPGARAFREERQRWGADSTVPETQIERLRRVMLPLLRGTEYAQRMDQVRVRIVEDPSINAGSTGGGQFIVTTGLLRKANDDQLRAVLAHEIAHDLLGHNARTQLLGMGMGAGIALLEQLIPGSGSVTPIAGALVLTGYSRPQEFEADRQAVKILERSGHAKDLMPNALIWLMKVNGDSGGGVLSTHPATSERIRALRTSR